MPRAPGGQCDWIRILWHPTAFFGEDARRLPLCLEPFEAAAVLAGFEKALVAQLASRSMADPKLFGRMLTVQDTESRFVSCLKTSARGNSFIKLKVCLDPEAGQLALKWAMTEHCRLSWALGCRKSSESSRISPQPAHDRTPSCCHAARARQKTLTMTAIATPPDDDDRMTG